MSLPRFLDRAGDAILAIAPALNRSDMRDHLDRITVAVTIREAELADDPGLAETFLLAVNLLSRLYGRLVVDAPTPLATRAMALARAINPSVQFNISDDSGARLLRLEIGGSSAEQHPDTVTVAAAGMVVFLDTPAASIPRVPCDVPAALAAAALGVGEVFRRAFDKWLPSEGRKCPTPLYFDLVRATYASGSDLSADLLRLPPGPLQLGDAQLAGAGAVGQATLLTLTKSPVLLDLTVVDPEGIDLSNLQRYVLTDDHSPGRSKVELAVEACYGSGVRVIPVRSNWGADRRSQPPLGTVLVALDSARDRIAVAAGLPTSVYNAWTQPSDLGWSRHERFGQDACLACLYWPTAPAPHEHQRIAAALDQHPLRILNYLLQGIPVSDPLIQVQASVGTPPPEVGVEAWRMTSLLSDLVTAAVIGDEQAASWVGRPLVQLDSEGICGGALIRPHHATAPTELIVPLAHQSVLAGIMLATQLIIARTPELREYRPERAIAQLDVLRPPPQILTRPRGRTGGCLCGDSTFRDVWSSK